MGVQLKFVAQAAMDEYFRDFKGNTGFFTLEDFIFRAGSVVADYYQRLYSEKYAELRQERQAKDNLVGVDPDVLSVQELKVENTLNGKSEATLLYPVMSFLYDKSGVGYQFVLPVEPSDVKLERSSMDEIWQQDYLPTTNRIFWRPQNGKIIFTSKGVCKVQSVELYYIPSVMNTEGEVLGETMIADGLVSIAVNATVAAMRQLQANVIVKEGLDGNNNPTLQTEINKAALK